MLQKVQLPRSPREDGCVGSPALVLLQGPAREQLLPFLLPSWACGLLGPPCPALPTVGGAPSLSFP